MTFKQATWIVDDFAINLQLCNEGIDSHKVDIPDVLLQMQKLRSCLGREWNDCVPKETEPLTVTNCVELSKLYNGLDSHTLNNN